MRNTEHISQRAAEILYAIVNTETSLQVMLRGELPKSTNQCNYYKGLIFHMCNLINSMTHIVQAERGRPYLREHSLIIKTSWR